MEQEEQENMDVPEDKDHIPEDEAEHEEMENEIAGTTKEQYYYLKKMKRKMIVNLKTKWKMNKI